MKKENKEEDDEKKQWLDEHVQQMIAMRDEMNADFIKGAKKQGMSNYFLLARIAS